MAVVLKWEINEGPAWCPEKGEKSFRNPHSALRFIRTKFFPGIRDFMCPDWETALQNHKEGKDEDEGLVDEALFIQSIDNQLKELSEGKSPDIVLSGLKKVFRRSNSRWKYPEVHFKVNVKNIEEQA